MEKVEVLQYKRKLCKRPKNRLPDFLEIFSKDQYLFLILAFLFGRCIIFDTSFFSSSFLSAYKKKDYFYYIISIFSILGIISTSNRALIIKYVTSILVITLINHFWDFNIYKKAIICSGSVMIGGILSIVILNLEIINYFYLAIEIIIASVSVIFFNRFMDILSQNRFFETEDIILFTLGIALSFIGLQGGISRAFDLSRVLFFILLFLIASNNGMLMSTSMGFIIGFLDSIKSQNPIENSCIFAFSSLMAGIMKNFGKLGTCIGGFCGYVIAVFYISSVPAVKLREIIIAAILFCLLPVEKLFFKNDDTEKEEGDSMIKEKFYGLASIIEGLKPEEERKVVPIISKQEAKRIIEDTCQKVCKNCKNSLFCWEQNYEQINHYLNLIKNIILKKGKVIEDDITPFSNECSMPREFLNVLNGLLETLRYSKLLENGIVQNENRFLKHLDVLKDVIIDAAQNTGHDKVKDDAIARQIQLELARYGYNVSKVEFYKLGSNFEADIHLDDGYKVPKKKEIERIIKAIVDCDIEIISEIPKISGGYEISFIKKPRIYVDYAIYSKSKDYINGDRVCFLQLKDGKFLSCISDGMGTGKAASENSFIVIDSLKKFLRLGFDRKVAVKFINSLLLIKNVEAFASIDICVIDRFLSKLEIFKMGAMPTYIKRGDDVIEFSSSSLPAGVDTNSTYEYFEYDLKIDDMIFMVSDGVLGLLGESGDEKLKNFIRVNEFASTQSAAREILNWAMSNSYAIKDDMTVLSLKIGG